MKRRQFLPILPLAGSAFTSLASFVCGKHISTGCPRMVHAPHSATDSGYPFGITEAEVMTILHEGKIQRSRLLGLIFQKVSRQNNRNLDYYRSLRSPTADLTPSGGFFSKRYCIKQGGTGLFVHMVYIRPLDFHERIQENSERHEAVLVVNEKHPDQIRGIADLFNDEGRRLCMHFIDQTWGLASDLNMQFAHHEKIPNEAFYEILRRFSNKVETFDASK